MTETFAFERYVNGVLMAEGVTIERQKNLSSAMRAASKLAARGSNGEVPVLVYCAKTYTEVEVQALIAAKLEEAADPAKLLMGLRKEAVRPSLLASLQENLRELITPDMTAALADRDERIRREEWERWTAAIETYFDATAVEGVEKHVAAIRAGGEGK